MKIFRYFFAFISFCSDYKQAPVDIIALPSWEQSLSKQPYEVWYYHDPDQKNEEIPLSV